MINRKNRVIPKISPDEQPQIANEVVNYLNGAAIVMDDLNNLYVYECPEENVVLGETIDAMLLTPIKLLPEPQQEEILKTVGDLIKEDKE